MIITIALGVVLGFILLACLPLILSVALWAIIIGLCVALLVAAVALLWNFPIMIPFMGVAVIISIARNRKDWLGKWREWRKRKK